jgi:hypothetical protein
MKKWIFRGIVFFTFAVLFTQCRTKEKPTEVTIEKFPQSSLDSTQKSEEQLEEERLKTITSIKFDKEVYDFGTCIEGDTVRKTIEFVNTGKLPLVIDQAYGSCGCTVPKYAKEPVQPGQKGKIDIEFNSDRRVGANTKSVMIQANTNPPITVVNFSINVKESKKKKSSWF